MTEIFGTMIKRQDLYRLLNIDGTGETKYFGYMGTKDRWYIMKLTPTEASYTYGVGNYEASWTNRTSLDYGFIDF